MIEPYEITNLLWVAANRPLWFARALEILREREGVYQKDEGRDNYRPYHPDAYQKS